MTGLGNFPRLRCGGRSTRPEGFGAVGMACGERLGELVTLIEGLEAGPAPAARAEVEVEGFMLKSGAAFGNVQSFSVFMEERPLPFWALRRETGERSECPEMRCTPPYMDWGPGMDECRSESSYLCADPGVELGRAMDAAAQESGSDSPEGERVGRLLGAENSEESGEKPKEDGELEERAALESEERLSLTGPEYTPSSVSAARRGRGGLASGSADGSEGGNW